MGRALAMPAGIRQLASVPSDIHKRFTAPDLCRAPDSMVMISIDFSYSRRRSRLMKPGAAQGIAPGLALLCAVMLLGPVQAHAGVPTSVGGEAPALRQPDAPFAAFGRDVISPVPERFAQSSASRFQQDRRTREISDQEHAKDRRDRGQNKSFDELFQRARSVGRGEYLGVEPDISSNIYRFKFMRTSGQVVWVDMDGQTGRVVAERE